MISFNLIKQRILDINKQTWYSRYEGRSKNSRKSVTIFLFCKLTELNYYSYIDKHDLYLYSKFCCSGMNTMLIVVGMDAVHQNLYKQYVCGKHMTSYKYVTSFGPYCLVGMPKMRREQRYSVNCVFGTYGNAH